MRAGQTAVGGLNAALGVGGVLGAGAAIVAGARERLYPAFGAGAAGSGVPLTAIAVVPTLGPLMLAVSGAGWTLFDIAGRTMLQRPIPDEKLTRTLGVLESA